MLFQSRNTQNVLQTFCSREQNTRNNLQLGRHAIFNNQKWWSPVIKKSKVKEQASVKYAKKTFSTKKNQVDFAVIVRVPQTTQHLPFSGSFCREIQLTKTPLHGYCSGLYVLVHVVVVVWLSSPIVDLDHYSAHANEIIVSLK